MIKNKTFLNLPEGRFALLILCLIFVLGACGPAGEEENNTNTTPTTSEGYPPANNESVGYPPIGPTTSDNESVAYPPPVALDKPLFQLDLPLKVGATTVSGQSPESLPLAIVDVTFGGVILGTGQSDEDGRFSIPVTPLPDGHRIGVTITEFEAGITFEEIAEQYFPYRGEGFMNVPNLGIFYDSAITEP
jgi:hypothetical protein